MTNNNVNIKKAKKYNFLLITIICLIAFTLGISLAFFTDRASIKQTITFGTISVNATTDSFVSTEVQRDGGIVMPGDTLYVSYNIENTGESAYFLTRVTISNSKTNSFDEIAGIYINNSNTGKLEGEEDKRVGKIQKNSDAISMKHKVVIPGTLNNLLQNESSTISIKVYAIQQANHTELEAFEELMIMIKTDGREIKYKIVNNVAYSYAIDDNGNEFATKEVSNAEIVTPQNVQSVLDGDINGKTIVFSEGTYDKVLIRPSKSTATVYKTIADQPTVFGEQVDISNGTSALTDQTYHYLRKIADVTFAGTENVKFTNEFRFYAGSITHVDTAVEHYDAVREMELVGTSYQYRPHFDVKNVTFTGLNFEGNLGKIYLYVVPYGESNTKFENITIKNCSFLNNTTDETKIASIHLAAGQLTTNPFKNINIIGNEISGGQIGIRVDAPNGITIKDNIISNTFDPAIALYGDGNISSIVGEVTISNNTITNCGEEGDHFAIRVHTTENAEVLISDNTIAGGGRLDTTTNIKNVIAVQKFNGTNYTITNNTQNGVALENVTNGTAEEKLIGLPA